MKEDDLRRVLKMMGLDLPKPNYSGWAHQSCPFAPWLHKGGQDKSGGFAVKVEDQGISSFSCPVCKQHGRIANLARLLGRYRQQDYSHVETEANKIEMLRMSHIPKWEDRVVNTQIEVLGEPLPEEEYDPLLIFEDVREYPEAVNFLRARRVNGAAVDKAGIRYDPEAKRIVFPVRDGAGGLHGFTGRTILPDHQPKVKDYLNLPKRLLILGEHRWDAHKPVIIVEGLFAFARFLTEGVDEHFNVGALLGSVLTPGKAAILRARHLPTYLFLDPDEAGRGGIFGPMRKTGKFHRDGSPEFFQDVESGAIYQLADHMPVFVPAYPEGVDDPDDLTLEQVLAQTRGLYPFAKPFLKKRP